MNEEQLVSYFNNRSIDGEIVNEERRGNIKTFLKSFLNILDIFKARFSFVFVILLICHCINLFFSILNKDLRLFFIGIVLLLASFLFSIAQCAVLYYKRERYNKRILADDSKVRIIKGGDVIEIDVAQLQCGDRLILAKGDIIPADSRVIKADNLYANEEEIFGKTSFGEDEKYCVPEYLWLPIKELDKSLIPELVKELHEPGAGLNKEEIKKVMKSVIGNSPFANETTVDDFFESYKKVKVILPK